MKITGTATVYKQITGNAEKATIDITMIDTTSSVDVTQSLIGHHVKWDEDAETHIADSETIEGIIYDAYCYKYGGHDDFPAWNEETVEYLDAETLLICIDCIDGDKAEIAELIDKTEKELLGNYNYTKGIEGE
jgi:hypothetical protein